MTPDTDTERVRQKAREEERTIIAAFLRAEAEWIQTRPFYHELLPHDALRIMAETVENGEYLLPPPGEDMRDLARRAVACKNWRWMGGMVAVGHARLPKGWFRVDEPHDVSGEWADALPDLTDPATLGCLLARVREVWNDPGFYVARSNTRIKDTDILGWDFFGNLHGKSCKGMLYRSEAHALVDALEAST